jgi:hypothetical protein
MEITPFQRSTPADKLTHAQRASVRGTVFQHLAGIAVAPVVKAISDRGLIAYLGEATEGVTLDDVVRKVHGNRGYLGVALRLLSSCGWLKRDGQEPPPRYSLTSEGRIALWLAPLYAEAVSFIPKALFLDDFLFGKTDKPIVPHLRSLVRKAGERWDIHLIGQATADRVHLQTIRHLDGMLVGPVMVALAREGVFRHMESASGGIDPRDLPGNPESMASVFELLEFQGWIQRQANRVQLTPIGRYAVQIAPAYGVTVSYLPMFDAIDTLLFGNAGFPRVDEWGGELLVNRGMNVWGSGGAHANYFKKGDEILVELFNRPIEEQPQGICDMGCGDGTMLEHVYDVVRSRTLRGRMMDKHPPMLVGADFSKVARRITKQRLRQAAIPSFHVIHGDINRPAALAGELEAFGLDLHNFLHIRSFLDHNRPYIPPAHYVSGSRRARSSGAFAYLGEEIPADQLEENLVRHFRRWTPYVGRFGMLVLELHTLLPEVTAANPERTPAVAYDATHGFSDQYLLELDVFLACAKEAGLVTDERLQACFPNVDLPTVSINYFTAPR